MGIKLISFTNVKSTNDEAIRLIKKNITRPTLIITKKQSKGRGQMGKKWLSITGNLFLSIFFEINHKKINFKQYAILNAFIIRKILSKYVLKKIKIKWPNDLLIDRKKVCGILQEVINHKEKKFMIVGVGINTLSSPNIFELQATNLCQYSKKKIDNKKILKDIKKIYEIFINQINRKNFSDLKNKFK